MHLPCRGHQSDYGERQNKDTVRLPRADLNLDLYQLNDTIKQGSVDEFGKLINAETKFLNLTV